MTIKILELTNTVREAAQYNTLLFVLFCTLMVLILFLTYMVFRLQGLVRLKDFNGAFWEKQSMEYRALMLEAMDKSVELTEALEREKRLNKTYSDASGLKLVK